MEALQTTLRKTAGNLQATPASHRLIYTTAATATVALLAYSRHCYLEWLALGEGGIPRSVLGWLVNVAAHVIARRDERAVPAPYEKASKSPKTTPKASSSKSSSSSSSATSIVLSAKDEERYGEYSRLSFFSFSFSSSSSSGTSSTLPPRKPHGNRPTVPTFVVPQRQTSEKASHATVSKMNAYMAAFAASNPSLFTIKASALESPKFPALWLSPSPSSSTSSTPVAVANAKWLPNGAPGEIAHVHHEGSTHVCLSLADAAEVVRKGWGERHKLAGVGKILPWGYVLVYAPREEDGSEDWEVWKGLVAAGARAVARSAGFKGEVVVPE
ncbi:hypothetical protein F5Y09DRAFT_148267 [Xylaria sp. FL1042]|nr:hypothetical protein F5Y09DRAFT_148267 [Xylaria sp. FL1042]